MSATAATPTIRALIAEDEALLAQALRHSLQRLWPALEILDIASNGIAAVQQTLSQLPDILFLDIKMPGQSGLDAAREIADEWPQQHPFPAIVFVTAYDQYAVQRTLAPPTLRQQSHYALSVPPSATRCD